MGCPLDYSLWTEILQKYVSDNGAVNYKYLKNNKSAFEIFEKMINSNMHINDVTYGYILDACGKGGQMDFALKIYNSLKLQDWIERKPSSTGEAMLSLNSLKTSATYKNLFFSVNKYVEEMIEHFNPMGCISDFRMKLHAKDILFLIHHHCVYCRLRRCKTDKSLW